MYLTGVSTHHVSTEFHLTNMARTHLVVGGNRGIGLALVQELVRPHTSQWLIALGLSLP